MNNSQLGHKERQKQLIIINFGRLNSQFIVPYIMRNEQKGVKSED